MKESIYSPSVYIILLNWDNSEETLACLKSLIKSSYNNFQVVVVDNNSQDDSVKKLQVFSDANAIYPITILRNSQNKGFAGGNNTGFEYALKEGADYVLVLNNDTIVDTIFLDELVVEAEKNKDVGIVGAAIYFDKLRNLLWFGGETQIAWHKMDKAISSELFKKEIPKFMPSLEVNFITGACMLIKKEVFEKVKGFDERFFLYFEDADLSLSVMEAGWKLHWAPKAKLWHKVSATTLPRLGSYKLHYYHTRNSMLLGEKHGPPWTFFYRPVWAIYTSAKQIIKIIVGRNRKVSLAILRGILDYYRERFGQYEKIWEK